MLLNFFTRGGAHVTTKPSRQHRVEPGHCIYAIGDVHGRVDLLDRLVRKIVLDQEKCSSARKMVMVFLGDYVDRGDQTRETLEYLIRLTDAGGYNVHCLLGNHEAALVDFLDGTANGEAWLKHGGLQTVASYGVNFAGADPSKGEIEGLRRSLEVAMGTHLCFLRGLKQFWRSGDYYFCHAGVDPDRPLNSQSKQTLISGHDAFVAGSGHKDARVVHGHYDAPEPVETPSRICVDTGAYYSGKLSAVKLSGQVSFLST